MATIRHWLLAALLLRRLSRNKQELSFAWCHRARVNRNFRLHPLSLQPPPRRSGFGWLRRLCFKNVSRMRKKQPKLLDWDKGIEDDIAFLAEHDPRALNGALNHMPRGETRRKWIMFFAKLGRLQQRAGSDEEAKAEAARMVALFRRPAKERRNARPRKIRAEAGGFA